MCTLPTLHVPIDTLWPRNLPAATSLCRIGFSASFSVKSYSEISLLSRVSYLGSFLALWTLLGISLCWGSSRCESAYRLPSEGNAPLDMIAKADLKFESCFSAYNNSSGWKRGCTYLSLFGLHSMIIFLLGIEIPHCVLLSAFKVRLFQVVSSLRLFSQLQSV